MQNIEIELKAPGAAKFKRYCFSGPGEWNEISRAQLLAFARLGLNPDQGRAKVDLIGPMYQMPNKIIAKLSRGHIAAITQTLDFLYQENTLTVNKLTILSPKTGSLLLGPKDSFQNTTWREFIVTDKYFRAFSKSQNIEILDYLISVLYRPKNSDRAAGRKLSTSELKTDERQPFNLMDLSQARAVVSGLDLSEKYAILFFYIGCYNELKLLYPNIFPEEIPIEGPGAAAKTDEQKTEQAQQAEQTEQPARDWLDFIRTLPNDKFGTIAQIENAFIHDTLYLCDKMIEDNRAANRLKKNPHA